MGDLTLREVCKKYKVSRRAVQGYESHKLVSATGKTIRGYLLYDDEAQSQIAKIKQYQDFGFKVKEIGRLFSSNSGTVRETLKNKLECLVNKQKRIEKLISELSLIIESM